MPAIFTRLYRERRRAAITFALLLLAGMVSFWTVPGQVMEVPRWIAAPALFSAALGTIFLAWGLVLPSRRHDSEAAALAILLIALLVRFGAGESMFAEALRFEAVLATAALIWILASAYADRWLDALLPRRTRAFTARTASRLPPERLYPALAQTPETAHLDPHPWIEQIEWIEPGVRQRVVSVAPSLGRFIEEQVIEAAQPPQRFRVRLDLIEAPAQVAGSVGWQDYRLEPAESGSRLTTERGFDDVTLRAWLYAWIDDAWGRTDDARIGRIEATAAAAAA